MSIPIIPSDLFGVHDILGVEIRNFGCDLAGNIRTLESGHTSNAGFTRFEGIPKFIDSVSNGSQGSNSGYDNLIHEILPFLKPTSRDPPTSRAQREAYEDKLLST